MQKPTDAKFRVSGIFIGFFWFLFNFFNNVLNSNQADNLLVGRLLLVGLLLLFIIFGYIAGRETKQIRHTIMTGMAASFIGAVIGLVLLFLSTYLFFDLLRNYTWVPGNLYSIRPGDSRYAIEDILGSSFFMTVFGLLFGAVTGGIGSSIGIRNSK
jgi:cytochrome c oxidase assembly factor CtaG